jgi:hypothetical protein
VIPDKGKKRTQQELAGHSTPLLTARYSHRRLQDLAGAVEKLPAFLPGCEDRPDAKVLPATGTEGPRRPVTVVDTDLACTPLAPRLALPPDIPEERLRTVENSSMRGEGNENRRNPLRATAVAND